MGAFLRTVAGKGLAMMVIVAATPAFVADAAHAYTDGPYTDVYYVNSCATSASINSAPVFSPATFGFMSTQQACPTALAGLQIDAGGA